MRFCWVAGVPILVPDECHSCKGLGAARISGKPQVAVQIIGTGRGPTSDLGGFATGLAI
jgi:hypothetical protein